MVDIYIVASKAEGGPKAILEASMTKTLIVSTNVGLASDILHGDLIYDENRTSELVSFLYETLKNERRKQEYINYNYHAVNSALEEENILEKYKSLLN